MVSERIQRRIDRLLDQVEEAMERLDWSSVRDCPKSALGLDAANNDAIAFLTSAEQVLGTDLTTSNPTDEPVVAESPTSSPPTSFASGRYEVKRLLGEGGKKKVYLGQDTLLDREVAFAVIKTEGMDEVSRTHITREAQAMGRLGSHPPSVTVFDLREHEGHVPAGRIPGHLQRVGHEALDGAGAFPAGNIEGLVFKVVTCT